MTTRGESKQEQARIGGFQNGKRKGRETAVMEESRSAGAQMPTRGESKRYRDDDETVTDHQSSIMIGF